MNNFVVFILTHGRAGRVVTEHCLRRSGYTGKIIFVLDDEDEQYPEYCEKYGAENIVRFSKSEISKTFDEMHKGSRKTIVYARNACFDIARKLGYRYFLELDDDYDQFFYMFTDTLEWNTHGRYNGMKSLDNVFRYTLEFFASTPNYVKSVAFGQGGDIIGGRNNGLMDAVRTKRKAMNTFFCDVERPFKFIGRINEDVNTYTLNGSRGDVFLTILQICINQQETQKSAGGMTDVYVQSGTYLKSFFTVMAMPSAVKVSVIGDKHPRIHHMIKWRNCVPKIVSESIKKK